MYTNNLQISVVSYMRGVFLTHVMDQSRTVQQAAFRMVIQETLRSLHLVGFTFMHTEQTFTVIPYHWLEKPGAEHKRYMQLVLGVRCCQQEMSQSPHRTICSSPDYNQSQAWKDMRGYEKGIWYTNLYIILTFKGPQLSLALNPWVPWILSNTWYPRAGIYRENDKSDWKCSCQS